MIEELSTWAEQIIVAVIIAGIIEMCLPSGNNKKYIKAVIGVYILFTIISPIISKFTNIKFEDINYEKYFEKVNTSETISQNLENNNDTTVKKIYISNLKQDMISKLKEKGYVTEKLEIEIENIDEINYAKINRINLTAYKTKEDIEKTNSMNNIVQVNKIENVNIGNTNKVNTQNKNEKKEITNIEINEIKDYLANVYEVKKKNIKVNENK